MSQPYIYTPSPDYINSLSFDYIETYSFKRGNAYEVTINDLRKEYEKLKVQKEKGVDFSNEEEQRFLELDKLCGYTQYLIDSKGEFHFSAIKTNTFQKGHIQIEILKQILNTKITEVPSFLCAPEYRDAVVFYDASGKIVSTLNVCLSCAYMETNMFHYVNGDYETYDLLKRFFVNCGHDVEEPNKFFMNFINEMKQKYLNAVASKTK